MGSQARGLMKPPIFGALASGTEAQQYLHRARMFRRAAMGQPNYVNGEPFWPTYALLTHAVELSLKAFAHYCVQAGKPPPQPEPHQHDLLGWYSVALDYGMEENPGMMEKVQILI